MTRTEHCGPDDVIGLLHRYYRGLRLTQDDIDGVDTGQAEAEKRKRRAPLSRALIRGDVIESLGRVRIEKDPAEALASSLAEIVPYSREEISETVARWMGRGFLKHEVSDGHATWRWS